MKYPKFFMVVVAICSIAPMIHAQRISEILSNKESSLTFYGIDFTKAVLIGDNAANTNDIVTRQFAGINDLMVNEAKKYDVAGALKRAELPTDLSIVAKRNEKVNPDRLLSSNTDDYNHITEADIQPIISNFATSGNAGTGLVFITEAMSKPKKSVSVWVTFFDVKSKKVVFTERIDGSVGMGFSFRNYWATGFKKIIDQIKNSKYKEWTKN